MNFQLLLVVFLIPLEVHGHTVSHSKALFRSKKIGQKNKAQTLCKIAGEIKNATSDDFDMNLITVCSALFWA